MTVEKRRAELEAEAESGQPEAMFDLAKALATEDPERSEDLYRSAAGRGDSRAAHNLGCLLEARGDVDAARQWYRQGADLGNDRAMVNLGILVERSDPEDAANLFRRAAEAGNVSGMYHLGILLYRSDPAQGSSWLERGVSEGHVKSMLALGRRLLETDRDRALSLLRRAAEAGEVKAMSRLGWALMDHPDDINEAEHWLSCAEREGDEIALYNLALLLRPTDRDRSKRLFERSAQRGDLDAILHLMDLASEDHDYEAARIWAEKAAAQGDPQAKAWLGWYIGQSPTIGARRRRRLSHRRFRKP